MKDLQKLSRYLKTTFHYLTFIVPLFIVALWFLKEWPPLYHAIRIGGFLDYVATPEGHLNLATANLTLTSIIIGCFAQLLGALPYILGFSLLKTLFNNYQQRQIFISANTQIYKKIGWLAFLNGLLFIPFAQTLLVLAATLSNPPGHRYITLSFTTPNFEAILCGFLIIVISLVMQEAQALQDENQLTI
ncbi:MAG: DUF2975 domain-containing protein [Pseudomonadota bacterium]|jgi:hypothetical protein|nr:DUF2975 domain-containing protein [Alphaproteobacteria bacterium]